MKKKELAELQKSCTEITAHSEELMDYVVEVADYPSKMNRTLEQLEKLASDPPQGFTEQWYESMMDTFMFSSTFASPDRIFKILRQAYAEGNVPIVRICTLWEDHPVRLSPFSLIEAQGNDLFRIWDYEDDTEQLLYSPSLSQMQRNLGSVGKHKLYQVLRTYTGLCWMAFGEYHYWDLTIDDLDQWAYLLDSKTYEEQGFTAVVVKHFLDFFLIDQVMNIPEVYHRGEKLEHCVRIIEDVRFDPEKLLGTWEITRRGKSLIRLSYEGITPAERARVRIQRQTLEKFHKDKETYWEDQSMRFPTVYYHAKQRVLVIEAQTASGYDLAWRLVRASTPNFDDNRKYVEPSWAYSSSLDTIIHQNPRIRTPWETYVKPFENKQKATQQSTDEMERFNSVLREIQDAHNNGTSFDAQKLAKQTGLSTEAIASIEKSLSSIMQKHQLVTEIPEADKHYLLDIAEPSPALKRFYRHTLLVSELFTVNGSEQVKQQFDVLTGQRYHDMLAQVPPEIIITDLFASPFEDYDTTVMNTTFHLLLATGEQWTPARTYAVTLIKWFGHVILPSLRVDYDEFIDLFCEFLVRKLCSHALCEVQSRPSKENRSQGNFLIRGTELLRTLISWRGQPL
jgi:hypothetical protein